MLLKKQTFFETSNFDEWKTTIKNTFGGLEINATDASVFKGSMEVCKLSDINFVMATSTPAKLWHPGTIGSFSENERFLVKTQFVGHSTIKFGANVVKLSPGDFLICDNSKNYSLEFDEETSILSIPLPLEILGRFHAKPVNLAFKRPDNALAVNKIISDYIQSLWSARSMQAANTHSDRLIEHYFDLLVMGYEVSDDLEITISSTQHAHLERCKKFIEDNLQNEFLTPTIVAQEFQISKRYLFSIFANAGLTVSAYIISQRLDRSAQMLRSHRFEKLTVSEIAFDGGFKSAAHFSRAFKTRFHESPSQYRKRRYN